MKFAWRIFFLCMGIYIISLVTTGIFMTENTYKSLLRKEIERSIEEENNLHSTLTLYLLNNKKMARQKVQLQSYSQSMVDLFETENNYLEIFDEKMNLLASNSTKAWFLPRQELEAALKEEKNFILRRDEEGNHFLFVTNVLQIDEEKIILSLIKDISHIDQQRKEQYLFFARIGVIGLVFVALITWGMSKLVIRPVEVLSLTAQNIAAGNYQERAQVTRRDEIGLLAEQFNMMAAEIEQKINQLEEESSRQQEFIDNLTHELRTPLTSIIGYAEFLQQVEYEPRLFQKSLGYIRSEGNRMLKLSNTLRDVILLREKALYLEEQEMKPLLTEVKDIMKVKAGDRDIKLAIQGGNISLRVDRDLMKTVLVNLVDNAVNASPSGATVTLGITGDENRIVIYVSDQGKGMAPEEISKVKEPFYRVDKSRSRQDGGIGLGLAICNQIIQGHGADLEIVSEPGKGTKAGIVFRGELKMESGEQE
ncbi:MAG: ATP-binding protein [Peptococcaceae bacterium]